MQRIRIKSYEEIKAFKNYRFNVDPLSVPINKIITDYELIDEIACGIKSCHQPHRYGYLVELANGWTTNVGNVCGQQFKNFDAKRDIYNREKRKILLIDEIGQRKSSILSRRTDVDELQAHETFLIKRRRNFTRLFPDLTKQLRIRLGRREFALTEARRRTTEEIERLKAMNSSTPTEKLQYEESIVGQLKGLSVFDFYTSNLIHDLKQAIQELDDVLLLQELGYPKLSTIGHLTENFDNNLSESQRILSEAEVFFTPDNFQVLKKLDLTPKEKALLNKLGPTNFIDPEKILSAPMKPKVDPLNSPMVRMMSNLSDGNKKK